uniref:Uncharacterized protein n=1 Tax=Rhizophora mucronata TaxID=61149 RepID=A0A2P2NTR6_RHIMU
MSVYVVSLDYFAAYGYRISNWLCLIYVLIAH